MRWLSLIVLFLLACGQPAVREAEHEPVRSDTLGIVLSFIYGLWSMDSGNTLYNEGFYFKPDGKVDFVASGHQGDWQLNAADTLQLVYPSFSYNKKSVDIFHIDSVSASRMVLSQGETSHVFRKVPFGINEEGILLKGYAGSIAGEESRFYDFDLPAARKVSVILNTTAPDISFRVFDEFREKTSAPVKQYSAIMVRSGKYRIQVINNGNGKEAEDFDMKIMSY